jgi:hypothetical protein
VHHIAPRVQHFQPGDALHSRRCDVVHGNVARPAAAGRDSHVDHTQI